MADNKSAELEAAEIRKLDAETHLTELKAAREQHWLELDKQKASRIRRHEAELQADDEARYVYRFDSAVSGVRVAECRDKLERWATTAPAGQPFEIIINSGGGSVFDGLELGDVIRAVSESGHPVTGRVAGMAASMAGVMLQFCDTRIIGRHSYLHLHEVSTGAVGKASDLADTAELAKRLTAQICSVYADRSDGKTKADELHEWIERQERWLTAGEALERGFCDYIG